MNISFTRYGEIRRGGRYEVHLSKLFGYDNLYRVKLIEEGAVKITECFNINLVRPSGRRKCEEYIRNLQEKVTVTKVGVVNGPVIFTPESKENFLDNLGIEKQSWTDGLKRL